MIRPVTLNDLWHIRRKPRSMVTLYNEAMLVSLHRPFWFALHCALEGSSPVRSAFFADESGSSAMAQAVGRGRRPEMDIVLLATDRMSNLVEREADIAVRNIRPTEPGLVARKVADLPVGIYAANGYLESHAVPRDVADLLKLEFVVAFQHLDTFRASLAGNGLAVDALRLAVTTNSHSTAWGLVRAGVGLGFAPVCIGNREAGVRRVLPEAPTPVLPVWMTVHQEVKANARLRRVYDFLAEHFAALN